MYGHFSRQRAACLRQYSKFIAEGPGETYREEFHVGNRDSRVLGEDKFTEKILIRLEVKPINPPSFEAVVNETYRKLAD